MRKIILLLLGAALLGGIAMLAFNMLVPPRPPVSVSDASRPPADDPVILPPDETDPVDAPLADGRGVGRPPKERDTGPADSPADPPVAGDDEAAYAAKICRGDGDGAQRSSLFGHRPSAEVGGGSLTGVPRGFGSGGCQQIHSTMAGALGRLLDAAKTDGLDGDIMGISCYRSIERQRQIFCNRDRIAARGYAGQAFSVAPPGYSEHATGFTIDFGSRADPGCNLQACFGGNRVGRWLAANAGRFGFTLSFPQGNAQGVTYEPWHYRYEGG